jgi:hypothetical protein
MAQLKAGWMKSAAAADAPATRAAHHSLNLARRDGRRIIRTVCPIATTLNTRSERTAGTDLRVKRASTMHE